MRPKATQRELVHMGRLATGVMVVIALTWIPAIRAACADGEPGLPKAARILLAAMPTVSVRLDEKMIADFHSLAAGTPNSPPV